MPHLFVYLRFKKVHTYKNKEKFLLSGKKILKSNKSKAKQNIYITSVTIKAQKVFGQLNDQ